MKSKHYIIILIIILVLAGLWWWLSQKESNTAEQQNTQTEQTQNTEEEEPEEVNATPATNQLASTDSVVVSVQANEASSVSVDNLNISKPSFVVIAIPGAAGKADQVIGVSGLISSGVKQDLEFNLRSGNKLDSSIEYTAMIYADDGDKKFDITKDTKVSGPNSSVTFSAE
jgi:cytoskeletal protein RodZ